MISNVVRTIIIRMITAVISLLVVLLAGRHLGASVLGEISLVLVSISMIHLVGGLAGGSALVYLIPRHAQAPLFRVSQMWALVSGTITAMILWVGGVFPWSHFIHVCLLGTIGSLLQNNLAILLVQQRIKEHNFISLLQSLLLVGTLVTVLFVFEINNIGAYFAALYISYGGTLIGSFLVAQQTKNVANQGSTSQMLKILFGYGSLVQLSSVLALLTYRFAYFYTEAWLGLAALGMLSVAFQISESVWIIPRSIAMVQFSKVANLKSKSHSANLTWFLMLLTTALCTMVLAVLYFIPNEWYALAFGSEFNELTPVVRAVLPGILAIAINTILSHYFSGTGLIKVNLMASAAGMLTVLSAGYIFISSGNIITSAWVTSTGYGATCLWSLIVFIRTSPSLSLKAGFEVFLQRQQVNQ